MTKSPAQARAPARRHRRVQIGKVAAYGIGSLLFFIGSILFFPSITTSHDRSAVVGSWMFVVGCIAFLLGTLGDLSEVLQSNRNTTRSLERSFQICNAAFACAAAAVFLIGSIFFVMDDDATRGCWLFLVGSVVFCIEAVVDLFLLCKTETWKLQAMRSSRAVVDMTSLGGAVFFIAGSWFYLPHFTAQEDTKRATHFQNVGMSYYTIGSVMFMMSTVPQLPELLNKVKPSAKAAVSTDKGAINFG